MVEALTFLMGLVLLLALPILGFFLVGVVTVAPAAIGMWVAARYGLNPNVCVALGVGLLALGVYVMFFTLPGRIFIMKVAPFLWFSLFWPVR
jgi:hypothetical protein